MKFSTPVRLGLNKSEVAEARKRVILKRFCLKHGIEHRADDATKWLMGKVRLFVYIQKNKPEWLYLLTANMTGEDVEKAAKGNHYVNNLVCMKIMFGLNSGIGIVEPTEDNPTRTIQCKTVADLVKLGLAAPQWLYLDYHMHKINVIKYNTPSPHSYQSSR